MEEKKKEGSFWTTFPGILTGCAAIITALGGLIAALVAIGLIAPKNTPTPVFATKVVVITWVPATSPAQPTKSPATATNTLAPQPVPPTLTPAPEEFFLVNLLSGKCIDVKGTPGTANETPLQLWDCEFSDPNTDQKWRFVNDGFLQNVLSEKCMEVRGSPGVNNEDPLQLWDCEFSDPQHTDQRWKMTRDGFIVNLLSGKCIDVMGTPGISNEDPLQLWDCESPSPSIDQQWKKQ
jgi:hypothetical protein